MDRVFADQLGGRAQHPFDAARGGTGFNEGIVWALRVRADRPEWQAEVRRFRDLLLRTVRWPSSCATNRLSLSGMATR